MRFLLAFLTAASLFTVSVVHAQIDSSSFLIRVFGGTDVDAPTVPVLQTATPISTDQIDIVWTTSTDNFVVSGYVLSRDGVPIATTTQTTFSDTALNASTTYSYAVRAFDPSFNYSSSSNIVLATTLSIPVPSPAEEGGGTQSTATRVVLNELRVQSGVSTTTFFIKTTRPARFELRWGRTSSYELGYVVTDRFADSYQTTITDLEPGTVYEYQVTGYNPRGGAYILEKGTFTTLGEGIMFTPANVARFQAENIANKDVSLSWDAPIESYSYVRLVRSHLGFPTHLQDGAVLYQGTDTSFIDGDVLSQFSPAYYTLFVVDAAGNVSSGAVAVVYATSGVGTPTGGVPQQPNTLDIGEPADEGVASTSPVLTKDEVMPELSQIYLIQDGVRTSLAERVVDMYNDTSFVISIPKEAVFENIKTIVVTITDATDSRKTYSFLLRINKDKTAYEGVFTPLPVEGVSRLRIDIYDFSKGIVGTYKKNILFVKREAEAIPIFPDLIIQKGIPLVLGMVFLVGVPGLLFLIFRRKRSIEDNT